MCSNTTAHVVLIISSNFRGSSSIKLALERLVAVYICFFKQREVCYV